MNEQAAFESGGDGRGARIHPEFCVDAGKMGVNLLISWEEFRSLRGRFGLFHVAIQCGARDPKGCTDLWNGMTLIRKHPPSQRYFPIGLELSWSSANMSSRLGRS